MESKEFERILLSREQITARIKELAAELDRDYAGKDPLFVGTLKGSVFFFTDLLKEMKIPVEIDFIAASSYGAGSQSSGNVKIEKDLSRPIDGRHVIIVEDMADTGHTLTCLLEMLGTRRPASIRICALMNKMERRAVPLTVDYIGFEVPDEFVVGYGLDYAEKYRNLPEVYVLSRHMYE